MTTNTNHRRALAMLANVSETDVANLAAMAPETLAQGLRFVHLAARRHVRADDVEALAGIILGRVFTGDVRKASDVAVHLAARTVALAHANVDSLDAWAGDTGGMVDAIARAGVDRSGLWSQWTPSPEARYSTTDTDVWRMALATVRMADVDAWRVLRDAGRAYMAHGDRRCHVCNGAEAEATGETSRTGRRVALAGILAHTRGLTGSDSQFHALRRLTLAAVATVDRRRVLAVAYGVKGDAHRGAWSDEAEAMARTLAPLSDAWRARLAGEAREARAPRMRPADEAPGKRETARRGLPDTDVVRVTRNGSTRVLSEARDLAPLRPAKGRADVLAEAMAGAPSRAVREGQRTRGNGPDLCAMVPARPSHAAPWRP